MPYNRQSPANGLTHTPATYFWGIGYGQFLPRAPAPACSAGKVRFIIPCFVRPGNHKTAPPLCTPPAGCDRIKERLSPERRKRPCRTSHSCPSGCLLGRYRKSAFGNMVCCRPKKSHFRKRFARSAGIMSADATAPRGPVRRRLVRWRNAGPNALLIRTFWYSASRYNRDTRRSSRSFRTRRTGKTRAGSGTASPAAPARGPPLCGRAAVY